MADWRDLQRELVCWQQAGRVPTLWWRDDDLQQPTPALARLTALSRQYRVPLALAAIPFGIEPNLAPLLQDEPLLSVLQHGYSHQNHAPAGERKCELGANRSTADVLDELQQGRRMLTYLLGECFVPVLVPPWNRLAPALVPLLPRCGFVGLSTMGPRPVAAPLRQVNVHVDLIDWRAGRGFVGEARALTLLIEHLRARRQGKADAAEASGIMTHHRVQDEAVWTFLAQLFDFTQQRFAQQPGGVWCSAETLFKPGPAPDPAAL